MTCRLFIDEVGNADLKGAAEDDNVRFLSLTGVLMKTAAHERRLQPAFADLKAVHFGDIGDKPVILHRRDILRTEGCFSVLRCPDRKASFNEQLINILTDVPYQVITVTIDKREHLERYKQWRYDPYHYCLACLVERYVTWLDRLDYRGDVVVEARFKKADKRLKASFAKLYKDGSSHVTPELMRARLLSGDIGMFNKAANVAGLQLADLLAHPSYRYMKRCRQEQQQPNDFGARVVDILLGSKYARNPATNKIDGWGIKWLP